MDTFYWILQYIHVLIAYLFIMFIWPSVVFRKHLKTKSRSYRFAFCWVVMIALINVFCIGLGLFKLLNVWLYRLVFYGIFVFSLVKGKKFNREIIRRLKYLIGGTYGFKSMLSDIFAFTKKKIKNTWDIFLTFMKGHWFEYTLLFIVFSFGLIYFSYSPLHDQSLGCGDSYVHCMWTYYITRGIIFSHGIYPEGMHFFMGSECMLFGIPLWNSLIFTGAINVLAQIMAMYLFFKELFRWKYSALLSTLLFCILNGSGGNQIFTLSRAQWGMPMEFAYPGMFLCAKYLIRFLRFSIVKKKSKEEKQAEKKHIRIPLIKKTLNIAIPLCFKDENLFIFMMAMASTITIHFYTTFFAFFLCLGVIFVLLYKIFSRKFIPLAVSVIVGLMISALPMAICFASGIPLQGSLYWGLRIMGLYTDDNPNEVSDVQDGAIEGDESKQGLSSNDKVEGEKTTEADTQDNNVRIATLYNKNLKLGAVATSAFLTNENAVSGSIGIIQHIESFFGMLKRGFSKSGHERTRALIYYYITIISFFVALFFTIIRTVFYKIKKTEAGHNPFLGYILLSVMASVVHLIIVSEEMGIPNMIEQYRICAMTFMMGLPAFIVPVDYVFGTIVRWLPNAVKNTLALGLLSATYIIIRATGNFHGYLMCQVSRSNNNILITKQIVDTLPEESYTIVSSTDELYQIIGKGYHEELVHFINESQRVSYTIPTEYIFIYVEKNVFRRGQCHFLEGPEWLASSTKYYDIIRETSFSSLGDEFLTIPINEELANIFFGKFPEEIDVYGRSWQRTVLNSKMYVWCQKFNAMYPNEMHVYYEDDDFVVFYLQQNQRNLYELAAMDPSVMVAPENYANPIWPENYAETMEKMTPEDEDEIQELKDIAESENDKESEEAE